MNKKKKKTEKKTFHSRPKRKSKKRAPRKDKINIDQYINKNQEQIIKQNKPYVNQYRFEDFNLHKKLLKLIEEAGYESPTEIQDKAIGAILSEKDVIGIASTGTGKTAAFLIPIIENLINDPKDQSALIITPTRELASQITDEFKKITKGLKLYTTSLIGGVSVNRSIKALQRVNHVIIGTPGRLIDMSQRGLLHLKNFKTLVLDEFDRMLDMGFLPDINKIISKMPAREQTLLFSATIEESQKPIVEKITNDPVKVTASKDSQSLPIIEQDVLLIPKGRNKYEMLFELISNEGGEKIIVFCETKRKVDELFSQLKKSDISVDIIHGDKTQKAREVALKKFKTGKINVLVATDVLARGIDVDDVSLVINYEIPRDYTDYIHRIGRTGRAGRLGKAITMVDQKYV